MIKSQDDLPGKGREVDVLLDTIDRVKYWHDVAEEKEKFIEKIRRYITSPKLSYESKVLKIYKLFKDRPL